MMWLGIIGCRWGPANLNGSLRDTHKIWPLGGILRGLAKRNLAPRNHKHARKEEAVTFQLPHTMSAEQSVEDPPAQNLPGEKLAKPPSLEPKTTINDTEWVTNVVPVLYLVLGQNGRAIHRTAHVNNYHMDRHRIQFRSHVTQIGHHTSAKCTATVSEKNHHGGFLMRQGIDTVAPMRPALPQQILQARYKLRSPPVGMPPKGLVQNHRKRNQPNQIVEDVDQSEMKG
jgi:hypothetical protein